jgi:hypothetical protein
VFFIFMQERAESLLSGEGMHKNKYLLEEGTFAISG